MARIINLHDEPQESVRLASEALYASGIIVFPTDTVYGLLMRSVLPENLARLNVIKGRQIDRPLAALAADEPRLVAAMRGAVEPICRAHISELVPGALTVVMAAGLWKDALAKELYLLPYEAIGVRIPRHAALQELIVACGGWVIATSANREGMPTQYALEDALEQLGDAGISVAVDGGECQSEASAVVQVTAQGIEIIRNHPMLTR